MLKILWNFAAESASPPALIINYASSRERKFNCSILAAGDYLRRKHFDWHRQVVLQGIICSSFVSSRDSFYRDALSLWANTLLRLNWR